MYMLITQRYYNITLIRLHYKFDMFTYLKTEAPILQKRLGAVFGWRGGGGSESRNVK